MATYWVTYTYSFTVESSAPSIPPPPFLEFRGWVFLGIADLAAIPAKPSLRLKRGWISARFTTIAFAPYSPRHALRAI